MSRGGQVELDFWRMERDQSYFKSRQRELLEPRTFVRGVRSSSETFAGSGPGIGGFHENWNRFFQSDHRSAFRSVPFHDNRSTLYSPLPLPLPLHNNQNLRGAAAEGSPDASTSRSGGAAENLNSPGTSTAPLTIFYKGTVSIFDVPSDKAALIMKLAEQGNLEKFVPAVHHHHGFQFYSLLSEELPLARKRSLKRFLERRKERVTSAAGWSEAEIEDNVYASAGVRGENFFSKIFRETNFAASLPAPPHRIPRRTRRSSHATGRE